MRLLPSRVKKKMRYAEYVFVNLIKALFFFLIVFMAYSKFCLKDLQNKLTRKSAFHQIWRVLPL